MRYYPAFLRLAGRPCLVVGGGEIAAQKVGALLSNQADVTVISPHLNSTLAEHAAAGHIHHRAKEYAHGDLAGFRLVIAATDDEKVQHQVAEEAASSGVLVNVVDRPELCDFIVPSVLERGDLLIAVSTSGQSPAMARRIRQQLEPQFGAQYAQALQLLGKLRQHLAAVAAAPAERKRILTALVESPLLDHLERGEAHALDLLLAETVGGGVSLAQLGVELS